jgi:hypothetical protein
MAMLYGAGRGFISTKLMSLVGGNLPLNILGGYTDNVLMGGLSYFMAKSRNKTLKKLGMNGLTAENLLLGAELGANLVPNGIKAVENKQVY